MDFERAVILVYTFVPVILGGIFNMIFMKLPVLARWRVPMDGGRVLADGRRLFGDNKTWKGFFGMVVLTTLWAVVLHAFSQMNALASLTLVPWANRSPLLEGIAMGFGYALAELPNSFVKRRCNVQPGTNRKGVLGYLFLVGDQADSALGAALAMSFVLPLVGTDVLFLVVFGTVLHYALNVVLYFAGLRKQAA